MSYYTPIVKLVGVPMTIKQAAGKALAVARETTKSLADFCLHQYDSYYQLESQPQQALRDLEIAQDKERKPRDIADIRIALDLIEFPARRRF